MRNLKTALKEFENILKPRTDNYKNECLFLCEALLGLTRADILTKENISDNNYKKIKKAAKKRAKGVPLQLVIGYSNFYNVKILENKYTLSPRPETELMVEHILNHEGTEKSVLDMCCGSGCIGIALKHAGMEEVILADISKKAIKSALKNAVINNAKVTIIRSNLFSNILGKYDIIVCNPPYIKSEDIKSLSHEVRKFDPIISLDGGEDGLRFYKEIAKNAHKYLMDGGVLYLEIGLGQEDDVVKLLEANFTNITVMKDLNNINRIIRAEKCF